MACSEGHGTSFSMDLWVEVSRIIRKYSKCPVWILISLAQALNCCLVKWNVYPSCTYACFKSADCKECLCTFLAGSLPRRFQEVNAGQRRDVTTMVTVQSSSMLEDTDVEILQARTCF